MCETEDEELLCIFYRESGFKMEKLPIARAGMYLQMLNPVVHVFSAGVCIKVNGLINANDL